MYIEATSPSRHYCPALSRYVFIHYRLHPGGVQAVVIVNEGTQEMSGHWRLLLLVMVVAPSASAHCGATLSRLSSSLPSPLSPTLSRALSATPFLRRHRIVHGPPRLSHPVTAPTNPHACSSSSCSRVRNRCGHWTALLAALPLGLVQESRQHQPEMV